MQRPDTETVRGRVWRWVEDNQADLKGRVLELGSRMDDPGHYWQDFRKLAPKAQWIGVDFQRGHNVDVTADIHLLPFDSNSFDCVLCAEVLEHVQDPKQVFQQTHRVLKPGGVFIVTTLFSFIEHDYPRDFWRFTRSALEYLGLEVGFHDYQTRYDGFYIMKLQNHSVAETPQEFKVPNHVFGRFVK